MRINVTGAALATLLVFCTGFKASAQGTLLKEARYEVNLTVGIVPGALVSSKEFPNSRYDIIMTYTISTNRTIQPGCFLKCLWMPTLYLRNG